MYACMYHKAGFAHTSTYLSGGIASVFWSPSGTEKGPGAPIISDLLAYKQGKRMDNYQVSGRYN